MDQLMIGYGVNNNSDGSIPPTAFNSGNILTTDNSNTRKPNQPKKELTLAEKHELASKLENEFSLEANETKNTSFSNSMSLNNIRPLNTNKNNNLADSLMDKNLADLNFNTSNSNKTSPIMPNSMSTNFTMQNSSQNRFPAANNNFINQNSNNLFGNMGNQSFQPQRPSVQSQNSMNMNMNNQQMGFFGNLALPAPTQDTSNSIKSNFPTIAPPPSISSLKPASNLNAFSNKTSPPKSNKKTALDDLADIFG